MYRLLVMLRALVVHFSLYGLAAAVTAYFLWHGMNGQRGLKTGEEYEQRLATLRFERDALKFERMQWEKRIALIRGEQVDADILEDEVRARLGRVHKNDVVILTPNAAGTAPR